MENAGRNAAEIIQREFDDGARVWIVAGVGNNGGDGLVIARHLYNFGRRVEVLVNANPEGMTPDTMTNYDIIRTMNLPIRVESDPNGSATRLQGVLPDDLIVDALMGTGFRGPVRGGVAAWIEAINKNTCRAVVAVDIPSGLDCDTGEPAHPTVRADLTITFVAMKKGFGAPAAREYVGRVLVADIGAPKELIEEIARDAQT